MWKSNNNYTRTAAKASMKHFVVERKANFSARGMTLIELLLVVAVICILAALAIPNLISTKRLTKDALASRTRLAQAADAQLRYREMTASRSFAKMCDLTKKSTPEGMLVSETVAKFDSGCTPQAVDDWIIADNPQVTVTPAYLKSNFSIVAYKSSKPEIMLCVHSDAVVRRGTYSAGCSQTSEPVE